MTWGRELRKGNWKVKRGKKRKRREMEIRDGKGKEMGKRVKKRKMRGEER
jgi:hypothetical protein